MIPTTAIAPESVASILAAADQLTHPKLAAQLADHPRWVEALWLIQWRSFQPGGLNQLAAELLGRFHDRVMSAGELAAGAPTADGRWTLNQCLAAWEAEYACGDSYYDKTAEFQAFLQWSRHVSPDNWGAEKLLGGASDPEQVERFSDLPKAVLNAGFQRFNYAFFAAIYQREAAEHLPSALRQLFEPFGNFDTGELNQPTWFPSLLDSVVEFADEHAQRTLARIAPTEITGKCYDALDYALAERSLVRIHGSARFGKTESLAAYCDAYPGRLRRVNVACSNAALDLVRAVAEPLGMAAGYGSGQQALRGKVEFVLRHGRLGFCFDEAHWLFPVKFSGNTSPERLNWLRSQIVNRRLPCILVSTPQAYTGQSRRFERVTGYNMDQWTGRIALTVELPDRISLADMTAVARLHFPELRESLVEMVVGAAKKSQSYLKAIEDISSRARWLARRREAAVVALRDIETAIADVVPELSAPEPEDLEAPEPLPLPSRRRGSAEVLRDVCRDRILSPESEQYGLPVRGQLAEV